MPEPVVDRWLRRQGWMDGVAGALQTAIGALYGALGRPGRALKNLLHGTSLLHHPLHPAITDIPMGAWLVGVVADYAAHYTDRVPNAAGDLALAVGLAAAGLAALTGYTDFHETFGHERRIALAHGLTMTVVVVLESASLGLRWFAGHGAHLTAVALASAALVLVIGGAYLGGHLVYAVGTMVNRNAFAEGPEDYTAAGSSADYPEGELRRVMAGALPVLMVRRAGTLRAIAAVCSHAGGPLDEGTLEGGIVVCPWHGSRFRLEDGRAVGGPACFGQPVLSVRETDGRVEVKTTVPLH